MTDYTGRANVFRGIKLGEIVINLSLLARFYKKKGKLHKLYGKKITKIRRPTRGN